MTTPRGIVSDYLNNPQGDRRCPEGVSVPDWGKVSESLQDAITDALVAKKWPLVMFGPPGLGKSCAMACIYMAWRGSALWFDSGEILRRIIACRTSNSKSVTRSLPGGGSVVEFEGTILSKIRDTDLICFDDVGVRTPTETQREIFEHLIDLRKDKPTILSTNLDHNKFADVFDMRLVSRVFCGTPLKVSQGQDRRLLYGNKIKEV